MSASMQLVISLLRLFSLLCEMPEMEMVSVSITHCYATHHSKPSWLKPIMIRLFSGSHGSPGLDSAVLSLHVLWAVVAHTAACSWVPNWSWNIQNGVTRIAGTCIRQLQFFVILQGHSISPSPSRHITETHDVTAGFQEDKNGRFKASSGLGAMSHSVICRICVKASRRPAKIHGGRKRLHFLMTFKVTLWQSVQSGTNRHDYFSKKSP